MSFSEEITTPYIKLANVFSDTIPYVNTNYIPDGLGYTGLSDLSEPVLFPTLYSFEDGATKLHRADGALDTLTETYDADYVDYRLQAIIVGPPHLNASDFGRSGFFDWQIGFNSVFLGRLRAFADIPDTEEDNFKGAMVVEGGAGVYMQKRVTDTHNFLVDFYVNSWNTSPYEIIYYRANIAGAVISRTYLGVGYDTDLEMLEALSGRGPIGADTQTVQVLKSTIFANADGDIRFVASDGTYPVPTPAPSDTREDAWGCPYFGVPTPVFEGRGEDLILYEATYNNKYDTHTYIRNDLKQRFKTSEIIENQRDAYVDALVSGFEERVSVTEEVPRGFTTRKQASPRTLRENYTTFVQGENMTTTPGGLASSMAGSTPIGMGTSGGGSY